MGRTTKTKQPHNLLRNADGQKDASEEKESCKINLQPKRPFAVLVVFWLVAHRVRCGHEPYSTLSRLDLAEFHDFWVRRCMQDHIGLLDYIHHFSTLITKLNHHFDQLTTWVHCLLHGADHTALWWTMIWQTPPIAAMTHISQCPFGTQTFCHKVHVTAKVLSMYLGNIWISAFMC